MSEIKSCVDCLHQDIETGVDSGCSPACSASGVVYRGETILLSLCSHERAYGECGQEGKLWQPKCS